MPSKPSKQPNLHHLRRSLARRTEAARRAARTASQADAFWLIWEDAARFGGLAREFWPIGRDAVLATFRTDDDTLACSRIMQFLTTLETIGLAQQAGRTLSNAGPHLSDDVLLEIIISIDMSRAVFSAFPNAFRDRIGALLDAAYNAQPTPHLTRLLGRILDTTSSTIHPGTADRRHGGGIETRALRFVRSQGTETVAGIRYEALYGLSRLLVEVDIDAIEFQDLEDITLTHRSGDSRSHEHVQAKKRDGD